MNEEHIPAISFLSVNKSYEQNDTRYDVLRDVTGHIRNGSITAIIGPSGSGKSTLLSLCSLMNSPDKGEVLVFGKEVRNWDIKELRKTAGLAFQSAPVIEGTVRDNLLLAEKLHQTQAYTPEELADFTDLPYELLDRNAKELSGGQRQKLSLARTLANPPSILLLDEITSALDPASVLVIEKLITSWHQQKKLTVLWITHNLEQAERISDTIWFMAEGRLLETADTETFFKDPKHEAARALLQGSGR
ncbi:ATP-binding cassette domain-containing protein [Bacillus sp. YC2]|uniref:ABC transporter ATP-binding protein n=1 Tax=Bacillus sp. YC2 TaxID=2861287 RepID=UPI001CA7929D|nr:ATP-binding cassette domain-containing protein [Bacillus sp. YC2]MBY8913777.1 ATP-binding cassette domain-containing protein [Bacillus sp. YC2]